jgi:hypothetical protein
MTQDVMQCLMPRVADMLSFLWFALPSFISAVGHLQIYHPRHHVEWIELEHYPAQQERARHIPGPGAPPSGISTCPISYLLIAT